MQPSIALLLRRSDEFARTRAFFLHAATYNPLVFRRTPLHGDFPGNPAIVFSFVTVMNSTLLTSSATSLLSNLAAKSSVLSE